LRAERAKELPQLGVVEGAGCYNHSMTPVPPANVRTRLAL
jgi:hypothetical protein